MILAIEVRVGQPLLNVESRRSLTDARAQIQRAQRTASPTGRLAAILAARRAVELGNRQLGTNLSFDIGEGTVMF